MLCSIRKLDDFELVARDGKIGHVRGAYFDDERWVIRHVVVRTGGWLSHRDVLISPHSIESMDGGKRQLVVNLSRQQVKDAPPIDTDKPVSRQHEIRHYDYYGYPYYWSGYALWGMGTHPMPRTALAPSAGKTGVPSEVAEMVDAERESADPHLRSSNEVIGYDIEAIDGSIGKIDDFLFDEHTWEIRYAVVDTARWLPGRRVLVSPKWIEGVSWSDHKAHFNVLRQQVKASPAYDRDGPPLSSDDETGLHSHYGRPFDRT